MNYRRGLVTLATFLGGAYFFLEFVLPAELGGVRTDLYHEQITLGFLAVGAMAVGLGLINLLMLHGSRIIFRRQGMLNSVALLLGLAAMMGVTIADWAGTASNSRRVRQLFMLRDFARVIAADMRGGKNPDESGKRRLALAASLEGALREVDLLGAQAAAAAKEEVLLLGKISSARTDIQGHAAAARDRLREMQAGAPVPALEALADDLGALAGRFGELLDAKYKLSLTRRAYGVLYDGLFVPLGAAMFSLLAFYMAAAAYRAFRVRSAESALMMCAAVLVMLGQIPFGIWIWDKFPEVRLWLLTVPNAAAFRGIAIGAGVAGLVMAFRMWLSIETESFSRDAKGRE